MRVQLSLLSFRLEQGFSLSTFEGVSAGQLNFSKTMIALFVKIYPVNQNVDFKFEEFKQNCSVDT